MELGIYSFAELTADPHTGKTVSAEQRMKDLLEEIVLADEVGLDVYGVGEHHRPDFISSAPSVILAAAAAKTKNIRLSSAVTVLSSEDPVRVFQQYSTLDLISGGRAEIMAGRGSFIESFPLFGYDLDDYDELFEEHLRLLMDLRESVELSWEGKHRPSIDGRGVYPRPVQSKLPVWIAVGGTPESVIRAASLGLPLAVAIIGGQPARFSPLVDLYREAVKRVGLDPLQMPVSINSHGFISDDASTAVEEAFPYHEVVMNRIGRERGWPPMSLAQFAQGAGPHGHLVLGNAEQVTEKILYEHSIFNNDRFMLQLTVGTMPHDRVMRAIELYGTEVAPAVRKALGK